MIRAPSFYMLAILLMAWPLLSAPFDPGTISPNISYLESMALENKLLQAFNEYGCEMVREVANPSQRTRMTVLGMSLVGYCVTDPSRADELFTMALLRGPEDPNVRLLHALYLHRKEPALAKQAWQKLLETSSDEPYQGLAKKGLAGEEIPKIVLNHRVHSFGIGLAGPIYETNPLDTPSSSPQPTPSLGLTTSGNVGAQWRFSEWGSWLGTYTVNYNAYLKNSAANLVEHDVELPLVLNAGARANLRIRPFGTLQYLNNAPFYGYAGLGLVGMMYHGYFRQILLSSFAPDYYFNSRLSPQAGTHFRFQYGWEFYPENWFIQILAYLDHTQAHSYTDSINGISIPYSNNQFLLQAFGEYDFKWIILSFLFQLILREDDRTAQYRIGSSTAPLIYKRRQDLNIALRPSVALPLGHGMHLIGTYRWVQRFSNIGPNDYSDMNFVDHAISLSFRATWGAF